MRKKVIFIFMLFLFVQNLISKTINGFVDYKMTIYNIRIGDNYNNTKDLFDWKWDSLNDPDGTQEKDGINSYLYFGEDFIQFDGNLWLPALFIETDREIIQSFRCSISFLFENNDNLEKSKENILDILSDKIVSLKDENVRKSIIESGNFLSEDERIIEKIDLVIKEDDSYHNFIYEIGLK